MNNLPGSHTEATRVDQTMHSSTYWVKQVFTPTTQAKVNFVPRPVPENALFDALDTPGKQIVIFGHSGCGKSTLLSKKLNEVYSDHITSRCQKATTYEHLLLDAFDQLDKYFVQESTKSQSEAQENSLTAGYQAIKAAIATYSTDAESTTNARIIPPQLTAQRLSQFLGERGMCWVLEDFHKIPETAKTPLAQALKVFCDEASRYEHVRIVLVGAAATAREVLQYDSEMRGRVAEVAVPPLSDEELHKILNRGEHLLNLEFPTEIKEEIVAFSSGLGATCHQIALNMCRARDVRSTASGPRLKFTLEDYGSAIDMLIEESSDSLKQTFDLATHRKRVRKFDNCSIILKAMASGSPAGMLHSEIFANIQATEPSFPQSNLTLYLGELQSEERGSVVRLDPSSRRFSFSEPLYYVYAKATLLPRPSDPKRPANAEHQDLWEALELKIQALFESRYSSPEVATSRQWNTTLPSGNVLSCEKQSGGLWMCQVKDSRTGHSRSVCSPAGSPENFDYDEERDCWSAS